MLANKLRMGGILDTQQLTVGVTTYKSGATYGFQSGLYGAVADGTFNPKAGAAITEIDWDTTTTNLRFVITAVVANDGWTSMQLNGVNYSRASATFSTGGGSTVWTWNAVADPMSALVATTIPVVFT